MPNGNTTLARFEYPLVFDITVPAPIDTRQTISSVANVDTEIVPGVRYDGLFVWVTDAQQFYVFKGGTTTSHFVPFSLGLTGVLTKFIYTSTSVINNGDLFNHGLGTQDFKIQGILNNAPVSFDYEFLAYDSNNPTAHLNNIRMLPPPGYSIPVGFKIVIFH